MLFPVYSRESLSGIGESSIWSLSFRAVHIQQAFEHDRGTDKLQRSAPPLQHRHFARLPQTVMPPALSQHRTLQTHAHRSSRPATRYQLGQRLSPPRLLRITMLPKDQHAQRQLPHRPSPYDARRYRHPYPPTNGHAAKARVGLNKDKYCVTAWDSPPDTEGLSRDVTSAVVYTAAQSSRGSQPYR